MRNIWFKISQFFKGRYGFDKLSYFLVILTLIFSFLSIFFFSTGFYVINVIIYSYVIFRALSKNFVLRANENRAFTSFYSKTRSFFNLQKRAFSERKTHVYRSCPKCKATLRLPRKKGTHTVKCPKCGERFEVKI